MTKSELINAVNEAAADAEIELTKKATGELIDILFEKVSAAINQEQRFSYPNFGTFTVKHRKAREGRNPRTKEPITIPASNTVNFKPSPTLKDLINE
jgi:DNA-binding protein HU-beta